MARQQASKAFSRRWTGWLWQRVNHFSHSTLSCFIYPCSFRTLLRYCFRQLRSTQVAILHCSAQTSPIHIIQKLNQSCIQVSSTNGRTYRPKDCENLILYMKDINLPKVDKWGTSQLIEFLQQVRVICSLGHAFNTFRPFRF
jgi:hypothetical protein